MTCLVDLVCLVGVLALGAYAIDYGDYLSGVLITDALILSVFLRRRWLRLGATSSQRWAVLIGRATDELDSW